MNAIRPIRVTPRYLKHPEGSCLFQMGDTKVLCTASLSDDVPDHAQAANKGWLSAEYSMLPRAYHHPILAQGESLRAEGPKKFRD